MIGFDKEKKNSKLPQEEKNVERPLRKKKLYKGLPQEEKKFGDAIARKK